MPPILEVFSMLCNHIRGVLARAPPRPGRARGGLHVEAVLHVEGREQRLVVEALYLA